MVSRMIVVMTIMLHDYGELCQVRPASIRQAIDSPPTVRLTARNSLQ